MLYFLLSIDLATKRSQNAVSPVLQTLHVGALKELQLKESLLALSAVFCL